MNLCQKSYSIINMDVVEKRKTMSYGTIWNNESTGTNPSYIWKDCFGKVQNNGTQSCFIHLERENIKQKCLLIWINSCINKLYYKYFHTQISITVVIYTEVCWSQHLFCKIENEMISSKKNHIRTQKRRKTNIWNSENNFFARNLR